VLTDIGFKNWTSEYVKEKKRGECLKENTVENCRYIFIESNSVVRDGGYDGALQHWALLSFVLPVIILGGLVLVVVVLKWIYRGFKKED